MEKQLSRTEINSVCIKTIKEIYEKKNDPYDFQQLIGAILKMHDNLIDRFSVTSLNDDLD